MQGDLKGNNHCRPASYNNVAANDLQPTLRNFSICLAITITALVILNVIVIVIDISSPNMGSLIYGVMDNLYRVHVPIKELVSATFVRID